MTPSSVRIWQKQCHTPRSHFLEHWRVFYQPQPNEDILGYNFLEDYPPFHLGMHLLTEHVHDDTRFHTL